MSLSELVPAAQALPRGEKLRLVQILVNELAADNDTGGLVPGAEYPVWSPFDAFEAADVMQRLLEERNRES